MPWDTRNQRRMLRFNNEYGHITLVKHGQDAIEDGVILPTGSVWLVASFFVKEEHRGQGHGQELLTEAAVKLTTEHGDVQVGLMGDTLARRKDSSEDARAAWGVFCTAHDLTTEDGFTLLPSDTVWR